LAVPRFLLNLGNMPAIRAVPIWIFDRKFRAWKKSNPEGTFAEFYVADAESRIARGQQHSTLGMRGWSSRGSTAVDWDINNFSGRGLVNWHQILALGLTPDMRCVDYGCGSLRLGQHAIRYLDPGNYFGVDLSDAFFTAGLKLLPPEMIESKQPRFGIISDALLESVRKWAPDFIFANAVLQHVAPDEVDRFLGNLKAMMTRATSAYLIYVSGERLHRIKPVTWSYPDALLEEKGHALFPKAKVHIKTANRSYQRLTGGNRKVLCIEPKR